MSRQHKAVVEQAQRLATEMPLAMVEALADAIEHSGGSPWASARSDTLQKVSQPHYRALASDFLDAWKAKAPELSPQAVSLALLTAAISEQANRERQSVELVWTGPETQVVPLRQTEQVILQVIESARERLLAISYAVYKIPRVCGALVRAADRGVRLRIVVEAGDRQGTHSVRSKLVALGGAVAGRAEVYYWPAEQRPRNETEGQGVLHVKGAVADGRWLLLTSANLTENAFTLNMEMGVLISGGPLPAQAERHFDRLIDAGVLRIP
jgi:phosphatidylserine/phosphatidylglycerophosphate/cardiolipin synthase-like enzyme